MKIHYGTGPNYLSGRVGLAWLRFGLQGYRIIFRVGRPKNRV
jgi:hypothetical protein